MNNMPMTREEELSALAALYDGEVDSEMDYSSIQQGPRENDRRRASDERYRKLDMRLFVAETSLKSISSAMKGQEDATKDLIHETRRNKEKISELASMIPNIEGSVLRAIAEHASTENKDRMRQTRTAFWTLLTVVISLGVTLAFTVLDQIFV